MLESQHLHAILWVLLSTAIWTVIFAATKFTDGTIGTFQLTFVRYIGALTTTLVIAMLQGGIGNFRSDQPFTHLLRAACGSSAAVAITWASANMPIVDATAIGLLYGVLAVVLGILVLGERVSYFQWGAIAVSLIGAVTVLIGKGAFQGNWASGPAFAALLSATLLAVEGLLIRLLGKSEKALSVMIYVCFFGMILMAVPAYFTWQPIEAPEVTYCLLLGPVAICAQYCTIRGYRMAPLSVVAPVDYSWLIFAAILGIVAFNEVPSLWGVAGGALILFGGVLLAIGGERSIVSEEAHKTQREV